MQNNVTCPTFVHNIKTTLFPWNYWFFSQSTLNFQKIVLTVTLTFCLLLSLHYPFWNNRSIMISKTMSDCWLLTAGYLEWIYFWYDLQLIIARSWNFVRIRVGVSCGKVDHNTSKQSHSLWLIRQQWFFRKQVGNMSQTLFSPAALRIILWCGCLYFAHNLWDVCHRVTVNKITAEDSPYKSTVQECQLLYY